MVFSVPVISQIDSIWVSGWEEGGVGWGRVWSHRQVKAPIWAQRAVLCLQYVIHEGGLDCYTCEEPLGTPCSPINAN